MKKGYSLFLYLLTFLAGAFISYILSQWRYLQIDVKVNVSTTLVALMTAMIGLYIATTLKRNQNKESNLHNYLFSKLNATWEKFINCSYQLEMNDQIKISDFAKHIKEINQGLLSLKQMFSSFGLKQDSLKTIEIDLEHIESLLMSRCTIEKNIVKYNSKKLELGKLNEGVNGHFVNALKEINKLS